MEEQKKFEIQMIDKDSEGKESTDSKDINFYNNHKNDDGQKSSGSNKLLKVFRDDSDKKVQSHSDRSSQNEEEIKEQ